MVIKVGINGFGRIGRIVSRACLQNSDLELSAINDPAISVEYVCYLLKFDSTHGKLKWNVSHTNHEIIIDDRLVKVFHEKLPANIPWCSAGVQYVVEASGMFTSLEKASGHLSSDGVRRVIVTAPSFDIPMIILGVNDDKISPDHKVISCTSSTLYCLTPIIKVLDENFGVKDGFITSIHAMTPSLKPLDGLCLRGRNWRDHRGIQQNIIPATTGACKALGKILPQVKDKLSGLAFRVPIVNVSVLDLTVRLNTFTTLREVTKSVEQASKSALKNIIKVCNEESVSSDFVGESHSCVYDADSSIQLTPEFFKLICWYENEYSYACRVVDTIIFSEHQIVLEIIIKTAQVKEMPLKENLVTRTERFKKETCAVCGKPEIKSKLTASTCQAAKVDSRPLSDKKQLSATTSQSSRMIKRNELCRIWNDSNVNSKPDVKQNRSDFLQRCMSFVQPQNKVESSAQERLEKVKKEYTKMVNMTEDLMKTSNQYSVQQIAKGEIKGEINDNNIKSKDFICMRDVESCRTCENNTQVEECGDFKNFIDFKRTKNSSKNEAASLSTCGKSQPYYCEFNNNVTKDSKKIIEIAKLEKNDRNNEIKDNLTSELTGLKPNLNSTCKQQLTKTINSLINGLTQNIQVQYVWNGQKVNQNTGTEKSKTENEIPEKSHKHLSKPNRQDVSLEKKANHPSEINKFDNREDKDNTVIKYKLNNGKSHIQVIDEELKKRKIILVDNTVMSETDPEPCNGRYNTFNEIDENIKDMGLPQKTLKGLAYTPGVVEDTFKCETPDNVPSLINNVYENRQDIFDKLDSASGSDSNNSFEVNERRSQVIQIADLTNSLEDLACLDKICRIIEISDDMSDKLFSALDNETAEGKVIALKKKRWSFRDFCERIKLDEFCNKVFGEVSHHQPLH